MADLGAQRYVSITSFRRDGTPVATPVWVLAHAGRLYVWTGAQTGKAKRIRRNTDLTLAPCTARGKVTGPPVKLRAEIVQAADRPAVWPKFLAKYGIQLRAIMWSGRFQRLLRRGQPPGPGRIYLELSQPESA
jgi:uncharacterized protein